MRRMTRLAVALLVAVGLSTRADAVGGYTFFPFAGAAANSTLDGTFASAQFGGPAGLASDSSGNVYVADAGSHTIRKITPARDVTTLAGLAGTSGSQDGTGSDARFNGPSAVAVDSAGNVYVADTGNNLVRKITPGGSVTTLAGGLAAQFSFPEGIVVDSAFNVYVANRGHDTIDRIAADGTLTTLAGLKDAPGSADGRGPAARFNLPTGLAIDAAGLIYVADRYNHTIRRVTPSGDVTTFAGVAGDPGPDTGSTLVTIHGTTDGPASVARFCEPLAVAVDGSSRVLVLSQTCVQSNFNLSVPVNYPNRLRAIAPDGSVTTLTGAEVLAPSFSGLMPASGGTVLLSGYGVSSVVALSSGGVVSAYAGRGTGCTTIYPTDGTRFEARFCSPGSMALDRAGVLYVADGYAVRKVTPSGIVTTLAGQVTTPGTVDGVASAARFGSSASFSGRTYGLILAASATGTVYVADTANHTLRRITPDGTVTTVVGQAGVPGSADGQGTNARLNFPQGVAVDAAGVVYIADSANCTIRKMTADGMVTTLAGIPSMSGSSDGTGPAARFNGPAGLAVDHAGILTVADTANHTIRRVTSSGVVTTLAGRAGTMSNPPVDGNGSAALFAYPQSLAMDGSGNAFVGQWPAYLREVTPAGDVTTILFSRTVNNGGGSYTVYQYGTIGTVDTAGSLYMPGASDGNVWIGVQGTSLTAPAITSDPSSQTVAAGAPATFSVTATGAPGPAYQWQVSADGGSSWTNLAEDATYSGTFTSTLTFTNPTVATPVRQFRCVVTNVMGSATSAAATLTVNGISLSPSSLRFTSARTPGTGAIGATTDPQTVAINYGGSGSPSFSASGDQPWLSVTMASGGAPAFTVSINKIAQSSSAVRTGTVTVTASTGPTATVSVSWTTLDSGTTSAPFGQVDTPAQGATGVQGAISVSGWVIDDVGILDVRIYRNCLAGEGGCETQIPTLPPVKIIGVATLVPGARPDIDAAFPQYPVANRAGWGYLLLTNMLPRTTGTSAAYGGQGPITLYAVARDLDDIAHHSTVLGRAWTGDQTPTSITLDNDHIAKPFGAIDTPAQGAAVSGALANFGWVLTPDSNTVADATDILMPVNGSTMNVFIDGVSVGNVTYNQCRGQVGNPVPSGLYCDDDVANIFGNATPQPTFTTRTANATLFRNLDAGRGAIGSFDIDTTRLANGLHTIAWGVTDSAGRTEGIGSRMFSVLNGVADAAVVSSARLSRELPDVATNARVSGRAGFDRAIPFEDVMPDSHGLRRVQIPDLGRVELQLGGPVSAGYLVAGDTLRDLPIGSHLDVTTGIFTWAPAPGYLGTYHFAFLSDGQRIPIDVTIRPMASAAAGGSEIRMNVDLPIASSTVSGPVTIAGWALDPQAWTGSGIDAIHVWAYRRDAPSTGPEFLGAADLRALRPDVAQAFGAEFDRAGFTLTTAALTPGEYDLVVYAWCARTGRWEDARVVRVTVR